jgi:hypothetical protein
MKAAPRTEIPEATASIAADTISMTPRADRGTRRRRRRSRTFYEVSWVTPATGNVDSQMFRQAPAAGRLADRLRLQAIDVEVAVASVTSWSVSR